MLGLWFPQALCWRDLRSPTMARLRSSHSWFRRCMPLGIPWAITVFLVVRRRILDAGSRDSLGPLTLLATVAAVFGLLLLYLFTPIMGQAYGLSPLALVVVCAPSLWWLWKLHMYRWMVALVLIPVVLSGSCIACYHEAASHPPLQRTVLRLSAERPYR